MIGMEIRSMLWVDSTTRRTRKKLAFRILAMLWDHDIEQGYNRESITIAYYIYIYICAHTHTPVDHDWDNLIYRSNKIKLHQSCWFLGYGEE